jgi:GNAT superfamily N-acetyltransferase
MEIDADALEIHEVTAKRWRDFEKLFESKGAPHYCWCMAYRVGKDEDLPDDASRKAAMHSRVKKRTKIGLLAYWEGEPIGWCSVGPRETFPKIGVKSREEDDGVWSITCFYVQRQYRKNRVLPRLLDEAVAFAKKHGARVVEGYPVDPGSPSYRFMGFVSSFRAAGFRAAGKVGTRRHIYRHG